MSNKSLLDIARDAANKTPMAEEDIVLLGVEFLKDRGFVFDKIAKLESENASLHEKYRWRKQSEEPAPKGVEVLLFDAYRKVFLIDTYCYKPDIDYVYWRPLDIPESTKRE